MHLLKALTYDVDAEGEPMPHMLVPLAWDTIARFFLTEVPRLQPLLSTSGHIAAPIDMTLTAGSRLDHPNIAAIDGLEDVGDVRALVMELVDGETLAERITRSSGRSAQEVGRLLSVASAVARAASRATRPTRLACCDRFRADPLASRAWTSWHASSRTGC